MNAAAPALSTLMVATRATNKSLVNSSRPHSAAMLQTPPSGGTRSWPLRAPSTPCSPSAVHPYRQRSRSGPATVPPVLALTWPEPFPLTSRLNTVHNTNTSSSSSRIFLRHLQWPRRPPLMRHPRRTPRLCLVLQLPDRATSLLLPRLPPSQRLRLHPIPTLLPRPRWHPK